MELIWLTNIPRDGAKVTLPLKITNKGKNTAMGQIIRPLGPF